MSNIYLTEQGAKIKKSYRRLIVEKDGKILLDIPEFKVDKIFIFGNIQITTQALTFFLNNGIDTNFFSLTGNFKGKLTSVESKNIYLRIEQYKKYFDNQFRIAIAKKLVGIKIKNHISMIKRFARNHPDIVLDDLTVELNKSKDNLVRKNKISTILGVEGQEASIFFKAFRRMLRNNMNFQTRIRRPPSNPVNSLLSLGYTLITTEMMSILSANGFDPYLGYLHGADYGRPSLALDLIEEFRSPVIDRLTLYLINNQIIDVQDFLNIEEKGYYLNENGKKKYFTNYEKYMNNQKYAFRNIFHRQVKCFTNTILRNEDYLPYRICK
ncbi:MAG TPA: CRISPR-associated endonuclease Cas1 [Candidatus Atribacteria bacterium]|nr:CRISPR-associated endonuclease Cas1 [Candidatus Atribacteria bacterium]